MYARIQDHLPDFDISQNIRKFGQYFINIPVFPFLRIVINIHDTGNTNFTFQPFITMAETNPLETTPKEGRQVQPGYKILVAEDEESNFRYVEKLLKKAGFDLLRANNGLEAVEYVEFDSNINLILMDIKMPVMNGVEATREIKKMKPEIPIIATTAFAIPGDREVFLNAGCDDYIPKPIRAGELIDMIMNHIA
jgi:CheY-like chemotaxis protein